MYLSLLLPVSDSKAVATQLGEELGWRMKAFNQQVNAGINAGIALNDQNKYDEALAAYGQVLAVYPAFMAPRLVPVPAHEHAMHIKTAESEFRHGIPAGGSSLEPVYRIERRRPKA